MSHESFTDHLLEGVRKGNTGEFQKVLPASEQGDTSLVMFKALQTLSNMHDVIADMYVQSGDETLANLHYQLANRIRTEALKARTKAQSK